MCCTRPATCLLSPRPLPVPPPYPHSSNVEAKPGTGVHGGKDSLWVLEGRDGSPSLADPSHYLLPLGFRTSGRKRLMRIRALTSSTMWASWHWTHS